MADPVETLELAIRRLGAAGETERAIKAAVAAPRALHAGERLVAEGDAPAGLHFVVSGVLKACRNLESGLAQTLALYTAGEVAGVQAVAVGREVATLSAVSPARVVLLPAPRLAELVSRHPDLAQAFWRATAREATILQEWAVGMGRRPAYNQIAHLLCEVALRMRLAGEGRGDRYPFPMTQTELADAVGLSPVHVNRVLQSLRAEGLIRLARHELRIEDWPRLAAVAEFDPTYLGVPASSGDAHAAVLFPPRDADGPGDRRAGRFMSER